MVQDRTSATPAGPAPKHPYLFPGANPPYPRTPDQLPIAKTSAAAPMRRPYLLTEKFPPGRRSRYKPHDRGYPSIHNRTNRGYRLKEERTMKQKITSLPEITSAPQGREYKPD